ncbi:DUF2637 domain-containing protein [Streptomyces daliensis]|uniref:DUF2637 domain-containing protein n=1 Tax=Streptomyces daliensis TaxID=299421 RepID=A0A8T4IID5_9ACTN|nr:DUF2637 domain-containing protein [Streptomyces daliensis]
MQAVQLTRTHRILIGVVVAGAVVIAAIGFAGSYAAVRDLAEKKGFGNFAPFFPIGIDAGIVVLLALDLLLTWIRIPFPLLRQTAWLLTAATIAFNGAAAWPDPLGVGMHAVIPVLFVVAVEAARHAIGRIADITADRHMEGVRVSRWLLAFPSTFRLWRRMKLWELRSYDEVIRMEQDRLVYEARLRARYGRTWRRKAPVESLMPLKLARYGIPLAETAHSGLAAAGITVEQRAVRGGYGSGSRPELAGSARGADVEPDTEAGPAGGVPEHIPGQGQSQGPDLTKDQGQDQGRFEAQAQDQDRFQGQPQAQPHPQDPRLTQDQEPAEDAPAPVYAAADGGPGGAQVTVPVGPGRRRALGNASAPVNGGSGATAYVPPQRAQSQEPGAVPEPEPPSATQAPAPAPAPTPEPEPYVEPDADPVGIPDGMPREDFYFAVYREFVAAQGSFPTSRQLSRVLYDSHGVCNSDGSLLSEQYLRGYMREFRERYNTEMGLAG